MESVIVLIVAFYLGWCFVNVAIAKQKGRDALGVLVASLFLSPLLTFLYILAVPARPLAADRSPQVPPPSPLIPEDSRSRSAIILTLILAGIALMVIVSLFRR